MYESWHSNGMMELKCNYVDDIINGVCESWGENGQFIEKTFFINGQNILNVL